MAWSSANESVVVDEGHPSPSETGSGPTHYQPVHKEPHEASPVTVYVTVSFNFDPVEVVSPTWNEVVEHAKRTGEFDMWKDSEGEDDYTLEDGEPV